MNSPGIGLRIGLVLVLASITLFFGLGRAPFLGSDEPRYAEIGREMWVSRDYISPRLGGKLWIEKPPLLYWGEAFFYSLLGANEMAARLPSAVCALLLVFGLWRCASLALGKNEGFYVAIVACSMLGIVVFAHGASTDMPLCATVSGALLCLWRSYVSRHKAVWWVLGAAAFAAGAMLAKGLIGPLFPLLIGGLWWLWARPKSPFSPVQRATTGLGALLVFFAVSAIWYWPVWARHGHWFWDEFFVHHHFHRYTSNEYGHPQKFYFFIFIALTFALPWTPWLFPAARQLPVLRPRVSQRDAFLSFMWVWALFPIAFFSLSISKLPSYILPSFPALAVLAGDQLARGALLYGAKPRWFALGGASLIAAVVVFLFAVYAPKHDENLSYRRLCLDVAAKMKPNETSTVFRLAKTYEPTFYLQGRIVTSPEPHRDTFVAYKNDDLLPLLQKGSLIVFCPSEDAHLLKNDGRFQTQFLSQQSTSKKSSIDAYRLSLR